MNFVRGFLLSLLIVSAGCKTAQPIQTILPPPAPKEEHASFDGEIQNSGILAYEDNIGFIITKNAKERYQALASIYGPTMVPPVLGDMGISPSGENFAMSSEAMSYFMLFTEKYKSGR